MLTLAQRATIDVCTRVIRGEATIGEAIRDVARETAATLATASGVQRLCVTAADLRAWTTSHSPRNRAERRAASRRA